MRCRLTTVTILLFPFMIFHWQELCIAIIYHCVIQVFLEVRPLTRIIPAPPGLAQVKFHNRESLCFQIQFTPSCLWVLFFPFVSWCSARAYVAFKLPLSLSPDLSSTNIGLSQFSFQLFNFIKVIFLCSWIKKDYSIIL